MTLTINVTDVNDNRPIFNIPPGGYQAFVFESAPVGFEAITVEATDLDTGDSQFITYTIDTNVTGVSVPFAILDPTVSHSLHNNNYRHCNDGSVYYYPALISDNGNSIKKCQLLLYDSIKRTVCKSISLFCCNSSTNIIVHALM